MRDTRSTVSLARGSRPAILLEVVLQEHRGLNALITLPEIGVEKPWGFKLGSLTADPLDCVDGFEQDRSLI